MSVSTPIVGLLSYVQNLQNSGENETRQDYKYWRRTTVTKYNDLNNCNTYITIYNYGIIIVRASMILIVF